MYQDDFDLFKLFKEYFGIININHFKYMNEVKVL